MKNTIILVLIGLIVISGCKRSTEVQSTEEGAAFEGVFAKGTDTLKIEMGWEGFIDFDLSASNEDVQAFVFNEAELDDYGDDYDRFVFRDSSEYTYEDLILTYSTRNDTWTIEDLVWNNKLDSTKLINLSGTFKRVE